MLSTGKRGLKPVADIRRPLIHRRELRFLCDDLQLDLCRCLSSSEVPDHSHRFGLFRRQAFRCHSATRLRSERGCMVLHCRSSPPILSSVRWVGAPTWARRNQAGMMSIMRPIKPASGCTPSWQMELEFINAGISDRSLAVLILICCAL